MVVRKKARKRKKEFYIPQLSPVEIKKEEAPEYRDFFYQLPQKEVEPEPAKLWQRAVAFLIDTLFVYFVFFQIFLRIYMPLAGIPVTKDYAAMVNYIQTNSFIFTKMAVGIFAFFVIYLLYLVLCEVKFHMTLGKKLLRLRVVSGEGKLSYTQAFLRNFTKTLLFPILLADLIPVLFTKDRQRFLEIFANTKVIYYPKLKLEYEGEF
jgi:uncharacterized RDD family membrane protein YckC